MPAVRQRSAGSGGVETSYPTASEEIIRSARLCRCPTTDARMCILAYVHSTSGTGTPAEEPQKLSLENPMPLDTAMS